MLPHHEMRGGLCRLTRFQSAVFLHPLENDSLNFLQQNNTADFILKRALLPQHRAGCNRQRLGPPERAGGLALRSALGQRGGARRGSLLRSRGPGARVEDPAGEAAALSKVINFPKEGTGAEGCLAWWLQGQKVSKGRPQRALPRRACLTRCWAFLFVWLLYRGVLGDPGPR